MGSTLSSTSSLGFPGGSLGCCGTSWHELCLCAGLLGHNLDLVVRQLYLLPLCNYGSVTSDVLFVYFSYMSCSMISLCRRVCDVPVCSTSLDLLIIRDSDV